MITETPFPTQLSRMDLDRLKAYKDNLDFYKGTQWEDVNRRKERRLTFNYARTFVDKLTSYLMSGLNFAVEPVNTTPEASEAAKKAEEAIYRVYEQNNLEELDFETETDAAILGDGCYKVTWDPAGKRVRITAPDVQGLYAWWLGDDTSRLWKVASKYSLSAEECKMLHGATPKGKKATIVEVWTADRFDLWVDSDLVRQDPNPYGFIPFVIFPNIREPKQFWGLSDIPAIMESQKELNRALSQLSRILELSGNPIAVLENVEDAEDIHVTPGALWALPEDARAYLLDLLQGGGVRLHIDYIDLLYRTLHDLSESPRSAFGGIERELSGVALEIDMHPVLQKVRRKRTIRTRAYKERNLMALQLLERFDEKWVHPVIPREGGESRQETGGGRGLTPNFSSLISQRIIWAPVLPQDKGRNAQNEQLLVQAGIHSRRRAMDDMGIMDPEQEFEKWLQERREILSMNQQFSARTGKGGPRERAFAAEPEGVEP